MKLFRELGESVEQVWRDANYNEDVFPTIAKNALQESNFPNKINAWEVIEWALKQTDLPEQKDLHASFGDPPITIYNAARFHIDVYFWFEGTTAIHQHGFCGAFQVLQGSSIHSHYDFVSQEKLNSFTEVGEISLKLCEILEVGDVQEILAGRKYIHSLFHLEQPSATIVIRTHKSPLFLPQYAYHKPNLAIDPFFEEPNTSKKLQALTALLRTEHPDTDKYITELLENSDFQTSFKILSTIRPYLQPNQMQELFNLDAPKKRLDKFLNVVAEKHKNLADVLPKIFEHFSKLDQIVKLRSYVSDSEQRFFLALLLNIDGRDRIFELIKSKYPESQPFEKVLEWVNKLANTRIIGAKSSNALGIANFDEFDLIVLENLLKGKSDSETITAINAEMPNEESDIVSQNIRTRIAKIRDAVIFEPLLK